MIAAGNVGDKHIARTSNRSFITCAPGITTVRPPLNLSISYVATPEIVSAYGVSEGRQEAHRGH